MKSEFNKNWNRSVQPRKQRKFLHNSPSHIQRKMMASPLDKSLKEKHRRNSIEVIKGDEVKIMRGKSKGKQGKVSIVDVKRTRIQVDGINRSKKTGDKIGIWFHPSKVKIISLNDKDARRFKNGNGKVKTKSEKVEENKTEKKLKTENKNEIQTK